MGTSLGLMRAELQSPQGFGCGKPFIVKTPFLGLIPFLAEGERTGNT